MKDLLEGVDPFAEAAPDPSLGRVVTGSARGVMSRPPLHAELVEPSRASLPTVADPLLRSEREPLRQLVTTRR
jgi:hypothetical protein